MNKSRSSISKRLRTPFKSPLQAKAAEVDKDGNASSNIIRQIEAAKQKCSQLDQEINLLMSEGLSVEELDQHIAKLHEYNEIKDAAQTVLGQIAVIDGVTFKELHEKYNLSLDE